jgi:transcriptional regulator with XRE-family HTH domain
MADDRSETPGAILREIQGSRGVREMARAAKVNHTTLGDYLNDVRGPSESLALRIADGLRFSRELRERWFRACGFPDPAASLTYEREPMSFVAGRGGTEGLPREDIELLEQEMDRLIGEMRRKRGLD